MPNYGPLVVLLWVAVAVFFAMFLAARGDKR